jgi:uncharacterized protein YcbX
MSDIQVASLHYYPIKSCAAVDATEVAFTEFGIEHDREWMLIGRNGQPLTQRVNPELALVEPRIDNNRLRINAPRIGEIALSLEADSEAEIIPVNLWKKPGSGSYAGDEASAYFTEFLGKDARLLRIEQPRHIKPENTVKGASERTAFADGYPILLTSLSSLNDLNTRLEDPVTIDRFRGNIVIRGAEAYDEDYWRALSIGDLSTFIVSACARCPIPNIPQDVGVLAKVRPVTEALRGYRQGIDPVNETVEEFFGQNLVHVFEPGITVAVGDKIVVAGRSSERNFRALPAVT